MSDDDATDLPEPATTRGKSPSDRRVTAIATTDVALFATAVAWITVVVIAFVQQARYNDGRTSSDDAWMTVLPWLIVGVSATGMWIAAIARSALLAWQPGRR